MTATVFIATSLDGYIADANNQLDWLHDIPNPNGDDFGFSAFMAEIDAIVMGRNTFDVVRGFAGDWPYTKPVYVLSHHLTQVPAGYEDRVFLLQGEPEEVLATLTKQGLSRLYIDGGKTIQAFLQSQLIDRLIITTIPVLLGSGVPLFAHLASRQYFQLTHSEILVSQLVKNHFVRKRDE